MPQTQKLSAEEKVKVIEDYINNRISLSEAARRGGCCARYDQSMGTKL